MGGRLQDPSPLTDTDPPASYKWEDIVWYNAFFLVIWHVGALYTLFYIFPYVTINEMLVLWVSLWIISGLGITMGAHRLWSHKAYKARLPVRIFLMFANSMAYEGTIFEWSRDHRIHHKGSETNADPHNARRGFFFSHCGWVMVRKQPQVINEGKKISCQDLLEDSVVVFQMNYYHLTVLFACYLFQTFLGWYYFNNAWNGFWLGGVFRHVWVLHMTWFVNSIDHFWGKRPYDPNIQPVENLFVAIVALGEGWHNYHHKYPSDYATSEFGTLTGNWNPTKTLIDICAFFGLTYDLRRSRTAKETRERVAKEQAILEEKRRKENEIAGTSIAKAWYESLFKKLFLRNRNTKKRTTCNTALLHSHQL